jgi:acetate kinase
MQSLVINSASSSIKLRHVEVAEKGSRERTTGSVALEGSIKGIVRAASIEVLGKHMPRSKTTLEVGDHGEALGVLFDRVGSSRGNIDAVGHRIVRGGDRYEKSTLITHEVEAGIDSLSELALLHNPACLAGIRGAKAVLGPSVPMVAVFDTVVNQTMPQVARQYAIPVDMAELHHIRRYGFHGIARGDLKPCPLP